MTTVVSERIDADDSYVGLRMTADEFLEIQDDGHFYELIDGVVTMSPSPTPRHQLLLSEIITDITLHVRATNVGRVFAELDVHLGQGPAGSDLVYRPEIVFVRKDRLAKIGRVLRGAPDVVIEIVSTGSRRMDTRTKRADYERFGVREYWIVDPERKAITFLRHNGSKFVEIEAQGDRYESQAIPGFALDLPRIREVFEKPW